MSCLDKHSPLRRPLASPSKSEIDFFLYIILWASAVFFTVCYCTYCWKIWNRRAFIGNLGEREILENHILSEGAGGLTVYAAKRERISWVVTKSEVLTIWHTREKRCEQNYTIIIWLIDRVMKWKKIQRGWVELWRCSSGDKAYWEVLSYSEMQEVHIRKYNFNIILSQMKSAVNPLIESYLFVLPRLPILVRINIQHVIYIQTSKSSEAIRISSIPPFIPVLILKRIVSFLLPTMLYIPPFHRPVTIPPIQIIPHTSKHDTFWTTVELRSSSEWHRMTLFNPGSW